VSACQHFLSDTPLENVILGNIIKLLWLNKTFQQFLKDVTHDVVAQYAQTLNVFVVIGWFEQHTSNFSWSSTVLVSLFPCTRPRNCHNQDDIGECMFLL